MVPRQPSRRNPRYLSAVTATSKEPEVIPLLDFSAADPIEDYLAALRLLEGVASDVHEGQLQQLAQKREHDGTPG